MWNILPRIILRHSYTLHLDCRLLAMTQKLPITKENVNSRLQRRSRHDLRIKLLAISYAVDISSGFTLFFLTKIGARTLLIERMLISLAVFFVFHTRALRISFFRIESAKHRTWKGMVSRNKIHICYNGNN